MCTSTHPTNSRHVASPTYRTENPSWQTDNEKITGELLEKVQNLCSPSLSFHTVKNLAEVVGEQYAPYGSPWDRLINGAHILLNRRECMISVEALKTLFQRNWIQLSFSQRCAPIAIKEPQNEISWTALRQILQMPTNETVENLLCQQPKLLTARWFWGYTSTRCIQNIMQKLPLQPHTYAVHLDCSGPFMLTWVDSSKSIKHFRFHVSAAGKFFLRSNHDYFPIETKRILPQASLAEYMSQFIQIIEEATEVNNEHYQELQKTLSDLTEQMHSLSRDRYIMLQYKYRTLNNQIASCHEKMIVMEPADCACTTLEKLLSPPSMDEDAAWLC